MKRLLCTLIMLVLLSCTTQLYSGTVSLKDVSVRGPVAYIKIERIYFDGLYGIVRQLDGVYLNKVVIDLFSFGGSLFDALAMCSLIEDWQRSGITVEIRARGLIASAGLLVLITGSPGHRYIDPNALVMFHELSNFKFFAVETPADKEDEAAIFRMIQNRVNAYIVARSKISLEDLTLRIKKKELWVDADGAVTHGFADHIIPVFKR